MNKVKTICHFVACIALFSGCATAPTGELKEVPIMNKGQAVATDARLRMITHINPGIASRPGRVDPNVITCTEPSPDVAAALARAGGFGISVLQYGSASLSGSQVESIAQLAERTTAIQALLHQGYQACLDYANGAITGTTYSLRTSRLDDLLVTLILAEVAGGAFGRSGAAIGTKASSEAQAKLIGFPEMLKDLDKAKEELDAAQQKVKEKEDAFKAAEKAYSDAAETDPNKAQLKATRDTKKAELEAATAEKNAVTQKLSTQAEAASKSAAEVNQLMAMGGLTQNPDAETAKMIGEMHQRFIEKDMEQAYISACLTELGSWKLPSDTDQKYAQSTIDQFDAFKNRATNNPDKLQEWVDKEKSISFFLASALTTRGTLLSDHCLQNLQEFISKAQDDRHSLRLKTLEIQSRQLDIADRQMEELSKKKEPIFPMATLNLLTKDVEGLKAQKRELEAQKIPNESQALTESQLKRLVDEQTNLSKQAETHISAAVTLLSDDEKREIKAIEDKYISLMDDIKRSGTPAEKKIWAADYSLQQANAEAKNKKMQDHSKKINGAAREIEDFIKQVKAIKN